MSTPTVINPNPAAKQGQTTTKRVTREDLVQLGQANKPWEFAPIVIQVLKAAPGDFGLRFLAAANFAKLGLSTAAKEQLAVIPDQAKADPAIAGLIQAIDGLPDDRIPFARLEAICKRNVETLARRGIDLGDAFDRWREYAAGCEVFRSLDGNVVWRKGPAAEPASWLKLADHRAMAKRFGEQYLADTTKDGAKPYTVEGVDPPWLLLEVAERTPVRKDEYQPRIAVVQADELEFLTGLSYVDLTDLIEHARCTFFVGAQAGPELFTDLRTRKETRIVGPYLPLLGLCTPVKPPVEQIIMSADAEMVALSKQLTVQVAKVYDARDAAWWAKRYATAGKGDRPLRVLVPTCRFSTFIKHSSEDLVQAFERAGYEARILIEPDDFSHVSSIAYLKQFVEFEPDLVVLINYTRANMGEVIPKNVPYVCWIQDSMPHQFDAAIGAQQTEFDFLVGHLHQELFSDFGFPSERTLEMPVVASTTKFHPEPVCDDLRKRFECEMAFISHHSETPEAMHDRLKAETGDEEQISIVLDKLFPQIRQAVTQCDQQMMAKLIEAAATEAFSSVFGGPPDSRSRAVLLRNYAVPVADRIFRHQALDWAKRICERRGWRLKIYGRGWDKHPEFAPLASSELHHGEELRAAYQCSAATLHVCATALTHQRVLECALSGGLPVSRLHRGCIGFMFGRAWHQLALNATPDLSHENPVRVGFSAEKHAVVADLIDACERLGVKAPVVWMTKERLGELASTPLKEPTAYPDWLLGELSEVGFMSEEHLESVVERAVEDPTWTAGRSATIASRVCDRFTHDRLVQQMVALTATSLTES